MLLSRHRNRRDKGATSLKDVTPSAAIPLEEMSVEDLKGYAADHEIEIGRSSSQDGILKKIQEFENPVDSEAEEAARLAAEAEAEAEEAAAKAAEEAGSEE
jgi:negative regulator of replication initiation